MSSGSLQGAERPKGDAEHRLPSSAGLEIGRSYTSASPLCLHRYGMGWLLALTFPLPRIESRFPGCRACSLVRNILTQCWHNQIATHEISAWSWLFRILPYYWWWNLCFINGVAYRKDYSNYIVQTDTLGKESEPEPLCLMTKPELLKWQTSVCMPVMARSFVSQSVS